MRAGFKKIAFANGLHVVLAPRPQSFAATVLILVRAGSEYESKATSGLSHFLEHLVFKGTAKRPKAGMIAEELASLGAQSNAFTSEEYTGYWAKAESHKLPKIFDIVSDLYLRPLFTPEEIEKERGVIIEEINMYEDTPTRRAQEIFTSLLYGDQPAGWDVAGRKEVIRKLARENFVEYRRKHYVAPKTVVVVAGGIAEKKALAQIREYFAELPRARAIHKPATKEKKQLRPELLVKFKESDQSHLVLGVCGLHAFDGRRHVLQVLGDVLGGGMSSRLFKKVREELGAAYYVHSSADFYMDHGHFTVSAGVDHGKFDIVVQAILEELARIGKEPIPPKELQRSKDHLVGNMLLSLETSDELAGFYGGQEILTRSIIPPHVLVDKIQAVNAEDVRHLAGRLLRRNRLNLAVIGPYKNRAALARHFYRSAGALP